MNYPKSMPNLQRFALALATESAQDLAPIIKAVADAKAVWDVELAASGSLDPAGPTAVALVAAGATLPTTTGVAYGDIGALRASLPAPLNTTNSEGDQNVTQSVEFQLGNVRGYSDFFECLRAPVFSDPAEPGDDELAAAKILLANIQEVYNAYETLTTQRGFSVPE